MKWQKQNCQLERRACLPSISISILMRLEGFGFPVMGRESTCIARRRTSISSPLEAVDCCCGRIGQTKQVSVRSCPCRCPCPKWLSLSRRQRLLISMVMVGWILCWQQKTDCIFGSTTAREVFRSEHHPHYQRVLSRASPASCLSTGTVTLMSIF